MREKKKTHPCQNICRNGDQGCWTWEPEKCMRFMPLEGCVLTEMYGTVVTPPGVDTDAFSQYFTNWIGSMGWEFCGSMGPYEVKKA